MSILFEPIEINGMQLPNRFVRSATQDACCSEEGDITDRSIELYSRLFPGGAGLIVTGHTYVHRNGQASLRQAAIDSDNHLAGLRRLVDTAHEYRAKIAVQLAHCGRNTRALGPRGETPLAPSLDPSFEETHRAMTASEIEAIIAAYGQAARRARLAGFDAIQIHAAHSYLLSQFLSPCSNQRTDQWGGNLENRMRLHRQVISAIRQAVGQDYPLMIKLGVKDTAKGGLTLEDGCRVARALVDCGIDAVEVSEGLEVARINHIRKGVKLRQDEAYYAAWAREVRQAVSVPVILVGGMRSFDIMERMVQDNYADCIAMCRPFIREPDIVHRWQTQSRGPAKCISCNLCVARIRRAEPVACVQEMKLAERRQVK